MTSAPLNFCLAKQISMSSFMKLGPDWIGYWTIYYAPPLLCKGNFEVRQWICAGVYTHDCSSFNLLQGSVCACDVIRKGVIHHKCDGMQSSPLSKKRTCVRNCKRKFASNSHFELSIPCKASSITCLQNQGFSGGPAGPWPNFIALLSTKICLA